LPANELAGYDDKAHKSGLFQSASADFVKVAQHFNGGQRFREGEAFAEPDFCKAGFQTVPTKMSAQYPITPYM